MTNSFPRRRVVLLSLALLLPLAGVAPAAAASSDAAMLQSYTGSYTGSGRIQADPPQSVRCRLTMQSTAAARLDYSGRCSAGGISFSLTGVITATNGKFTAAMSGTGGGMSGSGTVTGVRHGNGVVFTSKTQDSGTGHDRSISSSFTLSGGGVRLDFTVLDNKTGKTTAGSIPFVKG